MKRFLYYNEDSVNSSLAQIEKGLLTTENLGDENVKTSSNTQTLQGNITGDISAKVLGLGAALKGNINTTDTDNDVASHLIRSVQEKVLHDYAFEKLLSHAKESGIINNDSPKIGDYILITEETTFLDFDYFQTLFGDEGAVEFNIKQNKKKLDELKQSIPKGAQFTVLQKQQIKEVEEEIKKKESERKELKNTIKVIRNTLPYNRFIMTKNMLFTLDDENFRDDPSIIAFKYGGKLSMFGYVTNIVDQSETKEATNDFAPMYDAVNKVMLTIFKSQNKIYIVHPVAIYY